MSTPLEKGNALESAVHAIESAILKTSPALKENKFHIESRRIVTIGGVRHEIDIFVEVDIGKGYQSTFIFECKNWAIKVGKNEIIVFSEKIDALQAQKGFFVAKSFTSDAEAQAKKDARMVLLHATEREDTPVPFDFHFVVVEEIDTNLEFFQSNPRESTPGVPIDLDIIGAQAAIKGIDISLAEYANGWSEQLRNERLKTFASGTKPEGKHLLEAAGDRSYIADEFAINGNRVAYCRAHIKFAVRLVRPPVISDFEIETRGRVLSLAPVAVGDGHIQMGFIATLRESGDQ